MVSSAISILLPAFLAATASCMSPLPGALAFQAPSSRLARTNTAYRRALLSNEGEDLEECEYDVQNVLSRRSAIATSILSTLSVLPVTAAVAPAIADQGTAEGAGGGSMYEPKFVQTYDDFTSTSEGWSYKDVKIGNKDDGGGGLKDGDRVVFDWSGYTIGYFGRPFEAKG